MNADGKQQDKIENEEFPEDIVDVDADGMDIEDELGNKIKQNSIKINGEDNSKDTLLQGLSGGLAVKIQDSANSDDNHINQIN